MPFVFQWFERIGLNKLAPPAEDYKPPPSEKTLFDLLAPTNSSHDAESPASYAPSPDNFQTPAKGTDNDTVTPGTVLQVTDVHQLDATTQREMARAGLEMQKVAAKSEAFQADLKWIFDIINRKRPVTDREMDDLVAKINADLDNDTRPDDLLLLFGRTSRQFFAAGTSGDAPDGCTPLIACALRNKVKIAEILLRHKRDEQLQRCTCVGQLPIHVAAAYGSWEMYQYLESLNFYDKFVPDAMGFSPFLNAMTSPKNTKKGTFQDLYSPDDLSTLISPQRGPLSEIVQRSLAALGAQVGCVQVNGKRGYNEDAEAMAAWDENDSPVFFACVCDGHADSGEVSHFVAKNLPHALKQLDSITGWEERMVKACVMVDTELQEKRHGGGSTAIFVMVTQTEMMVANVGDSRCILIQRPVKGKDTNDITNAMAQLSLNGVSYKVAALSTDHKIEGQELKRMQAAGAPLREVTFKNKLGKEVTEWKYEKHGLGMSRAFGDFECKKTGLTCEPEVTVRPRSEEDAFLVLACDGLWDVHSNEEVAKMVIEETAKIPELTSAALDEVACRIASDSRHSDDNISMIIIALDRPRSDATPDVLPNLSGAQMMSPQRS